MRTRWSVGVSTDSRLREVIWTSTQQTTNEQNRQGLGKMERATLSIFTPHSLVAKSESVSLPLPYRHRRRSRSSRFFTPRRMAPILLDGGSVYVKLAGIKQYLQQLVDAHQDSNRITHLSLSLTCETCCPSSRDPSQTVKRTTTAGSHLTRPTLHEKHRHVTTTVLAVSRTMDEAPSLVVAIPVAQLRLSSTLR